MTLALTNEEQNLLQHFKSELMTDEESGEDGQLISRPIPWRSTAVNDLIDKIDAQPAANATHLSKMRVIGEPSIRQPKNVSADLISD